MIHRKHRWGRISRDGILFTVGLAGIIYETLVTGADRIQLLLLFAGMVGLPAFIRGDEQLKAPPSPSEPPPVEKRSENGSW